MLTRLEDIQEEIIRENRLINDYSDMILACKSRIDNLYFEIQKIKKTQEDKEEKNNLLKNRKEAVNQFHKDFQVNIKNSVDESNNSVKQLEESYLTAFKLDNHENVANIQDAFSMNSSDIDEDILKLVKKELLDIENGINELNRQIIALDQKKREKENSIRMLNEQIQGLQINIGRLQENLRDLNFKMQLFI